MRTVTAARSIFYHGTATGKDDSILRRVLKEGLIPNPKQKVWSGEGDFHKLRKQSLGGAYFSSNPRGIEQYMGEASRKLGGDELMVVARLETRSPALTADEEMIFSYYDIALAEWYAATFKWSKPDASSLISIITGSEVDWEDVARYFLKDKITENIRRKWKVSDKRLDTLIPLLAKAFEWQAKFEIATYYAETEKHVREWYRPFGYDEMTPEQIDKARESELRYRLREYWEYGEIDPHHAFAQYQKYQDAFLRKFRELAQAPEYYSESEFNRHDVRMLEPVTYRGANRIVAVVRIRTSWDYPSQTSWDLPYSFIAEVEYMTPEGKEPVERALDVFSHSKGPYMKVIDVNGNVIYDDPDPRKVEKVATYHGAIYRQAADPSIDQAIRSAAKQMIDGIIQDVEDDNEDFHFEMKESHGHHYADIHVDTNYGDLTIQFYENWRGKSAGASGVFRKGSDVLGINNHIALYLFTRTPSDREEAREEILEALTGRYSRWFTTLAHELVHYFDSKRYSKHPTVYDSKEQFPQYWNSPQELNARYQAKLADLDREFEIRVLSIGTPGSRERMEAFYNYFGDLPEKFALHHGSDRELTEANRRRIRKRLARAWEHYYQIAKGEGEEELQKTHSIRTEEELIDWFDEIETEVFESLVKYPFLIRILVDGDLEEFQTYLKHNVSQARPWVIKHLPENLLPLFNDLVEQLMLKVKEEYEGYED